MTVAELIAQLQALDPSMPVVIPDDDTADMVEAIGASVDTVGVIAGKLTLSYPDEDGAHHVVRLLGPTDDL